MMLKEVVSEFQKLYGNTVDQDNNSAILSDNNSKNERYNKERDNIVNNKNDNYKNTFTDINNDNAIKNDISNNNYELDNNVSKEDINKNNYELDNNISKDDISNNNYELDNNIYKEDNALEKPKISYDNDFYREKNEELAKTSHNIDIDNSGIMSNEEAANKIDYDNATEFGEDNTKYVSKMDMSNNILQSDNNSATMDMNDKAEASYTPKKWSEDFNRENNDAAKNDYQDIKSITNSYYPSEQLDSDIDMTNKQSELNAYYQKYQNEMDTTFNADENALNNNSSHIAKEFEKKLNSVNPSNLTQEEFWNKIGNDAKERFASQFSEENQKWYDKDEFIEALSNAIENSVEKSAAYLSTKAGEIMNIKDQFINYTLNFADNALNRLESVGVEMANRLLEQAEYNLYAILSTITKPSKFDPKGADGTSDLIGIDGVFNDDNYYLSQRFKPYEKSNQQGIISKILTGDTGAPYLYKDKYKNADKVDSYNRNAVAYNNKLQKNSVAYNEDDNNIGILNLKWVTELAGSTAAEQRKVKDYKTTLYQNQQANERFLQSGFLTVYDKYDTKNGKAIYTLDRQGCSSMFKGYQSIQETLKYGLDTDYYWDLTIGYYKDTWKKNGLPRFPYGGGWFPVKSFTLDEDKLETKDITGGKITIDILNGMRKFPNLLTLQIQDDYFKQVKLFGMQYNRAVARITDVTHKVLAYDDQAMRVNIIFMMPNYQTWRKISYIVIPMFSQSFKGDEQKNKAGDITLQMKIIGIADYDEDTENNWASFGYLRLTEPKQKEQKTNNETTVAAKATSNSVENSMLSMPKKEDPVYGPFRIEPEPKSDYFRYSQIRK